MRAVFNNKPKYSRITQGSIITGCVATGYDDTLVYGCIITARCDLEQKKVQTVHYLPMIPFEVWLRKDCSELIKSLWRDSLETSLSKQLKARNLSQSFLNRGLSRQDIEGLVHANFKEDDARVFMETFDILQLPECISIQDILNNKKGEGLLKQEIDRLIKNDNSNYYLLEDWRNDSISGYMIILLRDIKSISMKCALELPNGLLEEVWDNSFFDVNKLAKSNDISNIYYVDCEIASPYIEHILQRFSTNFLRIGVEDLPRMETSQQLFNFSKSVLL